MFCHSPPGYHCTAADVQKYPDELIEASVMLAVKKSLARLIRSESTTERLYPVGPERSLHEL